MDALCVAALFAGAAILSFSMIVYYRFLMRYQNESHEKKFFSRWTFAISIFLLFFFTIAYLMVGSFYLFQPALQPIDRLICLVCFLVSVFVYVMVAVQKQMFHVVARNTDEIIRTLVNVMEAKDPYTHGHSMHVANLVNVFYSYLPAKIKRKVNRIHLSDAALLHDIGKIGIPDDILNKPGALTEEEWTLIRSHPRISKQIMEATGFSEISDILLCHHERMDYQGYYHIPPDRIPLESRIIAIVDTFSALFSDRVYRPSKSYADSIQALKDVSGTQLDSALVDIFCSIPKHVILDATPDTFSVPRHKRYIPGTVEDNMRLDVVEASVYSSKLG